MFQIDSNLVVKRVVHHSIDQKLIIKYSSIFLTDKEFETSKTCVQFRNFRSGERLEMIAQSLNRHGIIQYSVFIIVLFFLRSDPTSKWMHNDISHLLVEMERFYSLENAIFPRRGGGDTRHIQHGNTLTNAFDNVSGGKGGRTIVFKILLFSRSPVFRRVCTTYPSIVTLLMKGFYKSAVG